MSKATSTTASKSAAKLYDYVRAAASLRMEILAFENDRDDIADGWNVLYCIDTNVLQLYLTPSRMGPRADDGGGGYGLVFPDDDDQTASALAAALSRYIFFDLADADANDDRIPLIILPGYEQESRKVYNTLEDRCKGFIDEIKSSRTALASSLDELSNSIDNEGEIDRLFKELFSDANPLHAFNRFNHLIHAGRIGRLAPLIPKIVSKWGLPGECEVAKALSAPNTVIDKVFEGVFRREWAARFKTARSEQNLANDVNALGRLTLINAYLKKMKSRLVLITGDQAMHKTARDFKPDYLDGRDFAHVYLRHPRAFLSSTQIIARIERPQDSEGGITSDLVVNWLDSLLSRFVEYDGPTLNSLREIAFGTSNAIKKEILKSNFDESTVIESLKQEWSSHAYELRKQHASTSSIARGEMERLLGKKKMRNYQEILDELDRTLLERSEETWQGFFRAIVRTGFDLFLANGDGDQIRHRNPPAIAFDSFKHTSAFVCRALGNRDGYDLRGDLDNSLPAIRDEDPSGYSEMLAYATLYSFRGNWYVAKLLAERAISIAERLQAGAKILAEKGRFARHISGREAYYFAAVAKRNCARTVEELRGIDDLLLKAEQSLDKDLKREQPTHLCPMRFKVEAIALLLTNFLFRYFSENQEMRSTMIQEAALLRNEFISFLQDIPSVPNGFTQRLAERHLLTNIFMCDAILDFEARKSRQADHYAHSIDEDVRGLYRRLSANLEKDDGPSISTTQLVEAVALYAKSRYGSLSNTEIRAVKSRAEDFSTTIKRKKDFLMPYDKNRYQLLSSEINFWLGMRSRRNINLS